MLCKYCHLTTHYIDECPTIICKICKKIGHPQWLCTEKKPNKVKYSEDIKKKTEILIQNDMKTISYYLKIESQIESWSDLIEI